MNHHQKILDQTLDRLRATFDAEMRHKAQIRLVGALRSISPERRAAEAEAAVARLAKQEILEAKLKSFTDDEIDKLDLA